MKRAFSILFAALLFCSCAIMPKDDRITRNSDLPNRFSPTVLMAARNWKVGIDFLKLRQNKTFVYRSEVMGIKSSYYSGTYTFDNGVLKLKFDYEREPGNLDAILVLDTKNGKPSFVGASTTLHIATHNLYAIVISSGFNELMSK